MADTHDSRPNGYSLWAMFESIMGYCKLLRRPCIVQRRPMHITFAFRPMDIVVSNNEMDGSA